MTSRLLNLLSRRALVTAVALSACSSAPSERVVRVVIPRGATVRAASDSLKRAGVIDNARFFRWYASFSKRDRAIKPGTYEMHPGEKWSEVLATLASGKALVHTITIPEGFDLRDITPLLARTLSVPEDSITAAVTDSAWRAKLQVPAATLEGYLFPATYTFPSGTTAREAVTAMLERFGESWKPEWDSAARARGLTRHAIVTMASIVEKEARVASERPVIAAVYWNRLQKNMRLQADPTVQYALPKHVGRVLYKDLEVDSRYNTYTHDGLPPGPIASPGAASLEAAVKPDSVSFLFFVAHPDGHHEFRNTFAEHQKAIAAVRRAAASPSR